MFKCEMCGKTSKSREKQHRKIIETRDKTYINEDKYGNEKKTKGTEIVKEIIVCEECSNKI